MTLLIAAAQYSGYDVPERCPDLTFVPVEQLREYVCPGRKCPIHGLYLYDQDELLIDDRRSLDKLDTRAVVVHELVHFLQDRAGETADTSCEAFVLRERVAFWAQEQYLRDNGVPVLLQHNLLYYGCDEPEAVE